MVARNYDKRDSAPNRALRRNPPTVRRCTADASGSAGKRRRRAWPGRRRNDEPWSDTGLPGSRLGQSADRGLGGISRSAITLFVDSGRAVAGGSLAAGGSRQPRGAECLRRARSLRLFAAAPLRHRAGVGGRCALATVRRYRGLSFAKFLRELRCPPVVWYSPEVVSGCAATAARNSGRRHGGQEEHLSGSVLTVDPKTHRARADLAPDIFTFMIKRPSAAWTVPTGAR